LVKHPLRSRQAVAYLYIPEFIHTVDWPANNQYQ